MQPHQYALAAGILWLLTLIVLPCLFAKARCRAYERGFADGKLAHQHTLKLQLQEARRDQEVLRAELEDTQRNCAQQLDARKARIAALKACIAELEARIMSYTGLAVTRADHDKLVVAADTLRLAQRTLTALKSEPQAARAGAQAEAIDDLAKRVHAQLRATPASAATAGAAA
ncbi:hypothetical protein [Pseudomonas sichuanensis]|uniref:hypothetical protein n=1 Tax=Pseudomonas sichuanensis TaxID=2213015 RepID=UPI0036E37B2A